MKLHYKKYTHYVNDSVKSEMFDIVWKRTRGQNSKKKQRWILNTVYSKTWFRIDQSIMPILWIIFMDNGGK